MHDFSGHGSDSEEAQPLMSRAQRKQSIGHSFPALAAAAKEAGVGHGWTQKRTTRNMRRQSVSDAGAAIEEAARLVDDIVDDSASNGSEDDDIKEESYGDDCDPDPPKLQHRTERVSSFPALAKMAGASRRNLGMDAEHENNNSDKAAPSRGRDGGALTRGRSMRNVRSNFGNPGSTMQLETATEAEETESK